MLRVLCSFLRMAMYSINKWCLFSVGYMVWCSIIFAVSKQLSVWKKIRENCKSKNNSNEAQSKCFWCWCLTTNMTIALDTVHRVEFLFNTFWKMDVRWWDKLFPTDMSRNLSSPRPHGGNIQNSVWGTKVNGRCQNNGHVNLGFRPAQLQF
jgi:hypothetical protein